MNTVAKITESDRCNGCSLCYNLCPTKAIEMVLSEKGFYVPVIDEKKCIKCSICLKNCTSAKEYNGGNKPKKIFSAFTKDEKTQLKSSSGGVFSELAKNFIKNHGVVFGATWTDDFKVKHIEIDKVEDIYKLRGSKYLQSYMGDTYSKIKEHIKNGKKVLFSGTSCEIASLLGLTDSPLLYVIDVFCYGVPSQKVFDKYIEFISKGKTPKSFNFRDKSKGWKNYRYNLEFTEGKSYNMDHGYDPFSAGFLKDIFLNNTCNGCKFNKIPRIGDISLGDFWGVKKEDLNNKGISIVSVNTDKGMELFLKLKADNCLEYKEITVDDMKRNNEGADFHKKDENQLKEEFFKDLQKDNFKTLNDKYIKFPVGFKLTMVRVKKKIKGLL